MRQRIHPFSTWYEATAERGAGYAPLRQAVSADCCVVGAGLAGLTTAHELARAGRQTLLLERDEVCWAASGRNGGFVSNGFALGAGDLVAAVGKDEARALYELSRLGSVHVREMIAAHDPSIRMGDGMRVCVRYDDHGGLQRHGAMLADTFGENVECQGTPSTRQVLRTLRYHDSLVFPQAFHIHPLRYGLLVAQLAARAGARIHEHSGVQAIGRDGTGWRVTTAQGSVTCKHVVVCVSALDRALHKPSGQAVLPVATYVAVTAPLDQSCIATRSAIADTRRAGDYYRLVDEGRLLWGGRITTQQREPRHLAGMMRGDMRRTFPDLTIPAIDYAWSGIMGYALHKMPLIGTTEPGLWHATGFGGHGLNTTAMAGLLLSRAISSGDDAYRRFALFPARWAGGPFGRLGVQSSYWWMQARDFADERLSRKATA